MTTKKVLPPINQQYNTRRLYMYTQLVCFTAMATPPPPPPPADPPQMTMTSSTGVITTEGYPNTNYANNLEQLWEISSSESDKVTCNYTLNQKYYNWEFN